MLRDRPFNLQGGGGGGGGGGAMFFFRSEFFFLTTRELHVEYFFCREFSIGYMTKTLNQIIFFSSTKIRIFFQQHWESEYLFRKKNIAPPP